MDSARWEQLSRHFDALLSLPRQERGAYLDGICRDDEPLRAELTSLLEAHETQPGFLEQSAAAETDQPAHLLPEGASLGAWRIVRFVGQGGMGEVYEVARADGQFEQRAALKVMRAEAARFQDRFDAERRILARLEHPGIVRLLDGGVTPDNRPYAVMEFIHGEPITAWCDSRATTLGQRLALFVQVCEAAQYAHGHLVVHRDIKPGNVLVDDSGRAHLLDFGIAKLLDVATPGQAAPGGVTAAFLTPDYAAPEQLTGEPVTTATDVYALGLLLYELLSGARPRGREVRSLAHLVRNVLDEGLLAASEAAATAGAPGVAARQLRGDLDAIVAKCLRVNPASRYSGVEALRLDILRSQRGEPVAARSHARWYRLGCFVNRYRWAAAAVAAILATMAFGTGIALWQARIARQEARNAAATRDFLIDVFRASDPRTLGDRPPGQITARELLDESVQRLQAEFADDPATQLQLLGVVSEIYGYWDDERFGDLQALRRELAERHFGRTHPAYIETSLMDVWQFVHEQEYAKAARLLAETQALIERGGHGDSVLQAQWWLARAEALRVGDAAERMKALDEAVALYSRVAPDSVDHAVALANSALAHQMRDEFDIARERNEQAVEAFARLTPTADNELALTWANLARNHQQLGDFDAAEQAYAQFKRIADPLSRAASPMIYWLGAADHARMLHLRGDVALAHEYFADVLGRIPADWDDTVHDVLAREYYAERLAAEGRTTEALPLLEAAEQTYQERPLRDFDLRRVRRTLGDAYDRAGRTEDAGRMLGAAREEYMRKDAPHMIAVLDARERWARWLIDRGRAEEAQRELDALVSDSRGPSAPLAMAQTDLARLAREASRPELALRHAREAVATLQGTRVLYDVRCEALIWQEYAQALEASGLHDEAREWLRRAQELEERLVTG